MTTSPYSRLVKPLATTTFTLASVTDTAGCTATVTGAPRITVIPPVPSNVTATAVSPNEVRVSWLNSGSVDKFLVYRNGNERVWETTFLQLSDTAVLPGKTYVYHVVAVKSQTQSPPSARDLATTIVLGTDLLSYSSAIRADHIVKLRAAVNAVRAAAGLAPAVFTDSDGALIAMPPKVMHIEQLRTALRDARTALGFSADSGQRILKSRESVMFANDVMEIRGGVQ